MFSLCLVGSTHIFVTVNMDTKQITLDGYVKSQKRPTNNDGVYKKAQMNSTIGVVKLSRQLSFDSSPQQTIKKQKVWFIYFNNLQFKFEVCQSIVLMHY